MSKQLIFLVTAFPYGNGEAYLETEIKYFDAFDSIQIFSLNIRKNQIGHIRELPSKFKVIPVFRPRVYVYILHAFGALFDKNLYSEIMYLFREKRFSVKRLAKLFIFLSHAHYDAEIIKRYIKKSKMGKPDEEGVIYSYRLTYQAYVGLLIQKKLPGYPVVASGHGSDLYEEQTSIDYIPLRKLLMEKLTRIIMISDDGKKYLTRKYPKLSEKIVVSRLGTSMHPVKQTNRPDEIFNIVSCSNVIELKRLDLIVKSLSLVKDLKVKWTHYGDGVLLDSIKSMCDELLGPNIMCDFRGSVQNVQIMEDYAEKDYHLFLNVSSTEGIPVSIMEALSFGIPCIATNVGGINEIIENGKNGILLDADFSPKELAGYVIDFAQISVVEYEYFRKNARKSWEEKYCADKNYPEFVSMLYTL